MLVLATVVFMCATATRHSLDCGMHMDGNTWWKGDFQMKCRVDGNGFHTELNGAHLQGVPRN